MRKERRKTMQHEIVSLNWDVKFMRLALHIAEWSKDQSRKVGCVIIGPRNDVRATGFNGFPRGVDDDTTHRHKRPAKYAWTEHAERNAIYNAAAAGTVLAGCRVYVPWYPCIDCARAIVQSGIIELIGFEPDWHDPKWAGDFELTQELFDEVGLTVRFLDPKLIEIGSTDRKVPAFP